MGIHKIPRSHSATTRFSLKIIRLREGHTPLEMLLFTQALMVPTHLPKGMIPNLRRLQQQSECMNVHILDRRRYSDHFMAPSISSAV